MQCTTSARVDDFFIKKTNLGLLIRSYPPKPVAAECAARVVMLGYVFACAHVWLYNFNDFD